MTEPKKPANPASSSEDEQARLKRLHEHGGRILTDNPDSARRAAQQEIQNIAERAIRYKESTGKYPWEEPESARDKQIATQQAEWLKSAGIDPDKSANDFLVKIKDAVRQIEAQKKTGGRTR